LLRKLEDCLHLLCDTGRIPEAAFLARTYLPSHVSRIVKLWKQDLKNVNEKAAESLADPMEYENLFPDIGLALKAEKYFSKREVRKPASSYPDTKDDIFRNLIEEVRNLDIGEEEEDLESVVGNIVKDTAKSTLQKPQIVPDVPKKIDTPTKSSPETPTKSSPETPTKVVTPIQVPKVKQEQEIDDEIERALADELSD